jgi:hypothetical protein
MSDPFATPPIDTILKPYLAATDEDAANSAADVIFAEHTIRDVDRIIAFKVRGARIDAQAASDLKSEVLVQLWIRLRKCRQGSEPIRCWSTYVKQTTQNIWRAYLRRKRPVWHALKNRIRYVLRNERGLTLWQDVNGDWLCSLLPWRARPPVDMERLSGIVNGSPPIRNDGSLTGTSPKTLAGQLRALLRDAGGPVDLDTVVGVMFRAQGKEYHLVSEAEPNVGRSMAAAAVPIDEELARRETLGRLWSEICALPSNQLNALLLNLRGDDGFPALELFTLAGIVEIPAMAPALGLSADDLARLLPHLPLDDATIGSMIGKTVQQVINLRKSARDRLRRRMKAA